MATAETKTDQTAELLALAERVEQATGPSLSLDRLIHVTLFGAVDAAPVGLAYGDPFDPLRGHSHPFKFTGQVGDAEMALPGPEWPEWQITRRYGTGYHANVGMGDDGVGCENAALALTAAALRARAALARSSVELGDGG